MAKTEELDRNERSDALTREDERHLVDFCIACVQESAEAQKITRERWAVLWDMFLEKPPRSFRYKEAWQNKIVVPFPKMSAYYGVATAKKAFSPSYLSVKDERFPEVGEFWQKLMEVQLSDRYGKFVSVYLDALLMGIVLGISSEIIPRYTPGAGLSFDLIEPWKIYRDPDAPPRDPWGGLYHIHAEWLDYSVLLRGEKEGRFYGVERIKDLFGGRGDSDEDPHMDRDAVKKRREMYCWESAQNPFRKKILTYEFYGTVLDKDGEFLYENAHYVVAGGRVIKKPRQVRMDVRWPKVSFSPLPHPLTYGGFGLLEGTLDLWEAMCNLASTAADAFVWQVDPPVEVTDARLRYPEDAAGLEPGKAYLVKDDPHGVPAFRPQERRDITGSALYHLDWYGKKAEEGSTITPSVRGGEGYRDRVTAEEARQNLRQATSIYALIGENLERGAKYVLWTAMAMMREYAPKPDIIRFVGGELIQELGIVLKYDPDTGRTTLPGLSGEFSISGLQSMMLDETILMNLRDFWAPMMESQRAAKWINPHQLLKSIAERDNTKDEGIIPDDDERSAELTRIDQEQLAGREAAGAAENEMRIEAEAMDLDERAAQAAAPVTDMEENI